MITQQIRRKHLVITSEQVIRLLLFLYLCGLNGHNSGVGFDAFFCRGTFVLLIGAEVIFLRKVFLTSALKWYAGFIGLYFVSMLWSRDLDDFLSLAVLNSFIQIVGVIIVVGNHFHTRNDYEFGYKCLLWSVVYMCVLLILRTPLNAWGSERVGESIWLNPNSIGLRTSVGFILCLYFSKQKKSYYFLAIAMGVIALLSGSRKAFIFILLEITLFMLGKDNGWKTVLNICLVAIACGAIVYAVFNVPALYDVLGKRIEIFLISSFGINVTHQYSMSVIDGSADERAQFRQMAIQMFFERPILGWGGNGFVTEMRRINFRHIAYSHCNYTELLATLGVSGLLLYYWKPVASLIRGTKIFLGNKDRLLLAALIVNAVYMVLDYYYVAYYDVFTLIVLTINISYIEYKFKYQSKNDENLKRFQGAYKG